MPTYYSDRVRSDGAHHIKSGFGLIADVCVVSVGTALINNDIIKLFTVPKGARVLGLSVAGHGVQSGTDSVYTIGDTGDTDRLVTTANGLNLRSNNAVQNIGIGSIAGASAGIGHVYAANTDIEMLITTAGTGMTTGGRIICMILYWME